MQCAMCCISKIQKDSYDETMNHETLNYEHYLAAVQHFPFHIFKSKPSDV